MRTKIKKRRDGTGYRKTVSLIPFAGSEMALVGKPIEGMLLFSCSWYREDQPRSWIDWVMGVERSPLWIMDEEFVPLAGELRDILKGEY